MADRWWVNDDGDGDWNAANNWAAAEGGAGGVGVPSAADKALFSDTSSPANCTLSANADCLNLYDTPANTGGTDNYTGDFDAATFDIHIHGDCLWLNNVGAMDLGSGTWTCDGHFEWDVATWDQGTSTLVMTTDGKQIRPDAHHRFLHHITLQGNISWAYVCNINGAFSLANGKTSSGSSLSILGAWGSIAGATIANSLIVGPANLPIETLPTDGTLNGTVTFHHYFGSYPEVPARAFGGDVVFVQDARDRDGFVLGSGPGQTFDIAGKLTFLHYAGIAGNTITYDAQTYDPNINVVGNLDVDMGGVITCHMQMGDGTWTVSGDCDMREATVAAGASELVLDGVGKSFWGNAQTFYDLTIEDSLVFEDGFVVSNLFKCITASKTLTFLSGGTYAFADVELDGQAEGTRIVLAPSGVAAYNWNVTADPQTDVSFVDVSYCDASAGSEIDASNGTNNDGGNNVNWRFGVAVVPPIHIAELERETLGLSSLQQQSIHVADLERMGLHVDLD